MSLGSFIGKGLDGFEQRRLRKDAEALLDRPPRDDGPHLTRLRALTGEHARLRKELADRQAALFTAAVPVTTQVLEEAVERFLFANPERMSQMSARKIKRLKKRMPKLLGKADEITKRRLTAALGPWPHKKEGAAAGWTAVFPTMAISGEAVFWVQENVSEFRLDKQVDGVSTGLGSAAGGGSFLGGAVLAGLVNASRSDDRQFPQVNTPPEVTEYEAARARYELLLPELSRVEADLQGARRAAREEAVAAGHKRDISQRDVGSEQQAATVERAKDTWRNAR